ncbi:MAG: M18 family aminopeptidase [Proteobacteria bacterium]|nr:M18 family aminopeptidase [Pseudomonadota bacterium]
MNNADFNQQLIDFLNASPTPFHATQNMAEVLSQNGFSELKEPENWDTPPGKYFVTRNDSSIVAFIKGTDPLEETGIRMVGAHTDSPCLKVKPRPDRNSEGYQQLGVEVYGGVLMNPWFDRDLSLAGRITFKNKKNQVTSALINLEQPIAVIPSLAIHLDREANTARTINPETDLPPLLLNEKEAFTFNSLLEEAAQGGEILATDLCFYDTNPAQIIGVNGDFLASARLDNLLSCFTGLVSLLSADSSVSSLLVCNDHEEVGSDSTSGAGGTFLRDVLTRITPDESSRIRTFSKSLLVSTDNAHGVHPNYPDKHEVNHGPVLNKGPAIKFNAKQRYATNSETAGYFKALCQKVDVECQEFVSRADMACGSTIGPITAKELGVRTLDVGVPTFAMHSIRELAGIKDAFELYRVLSEFYRDPGPLGAQA